MVYVLGINVPDNQLARYALTAFYGIGHKTSHRVCARLLIHDHCKIKDLEPSQVTALSAFLASPHTAVTPPKLQLAPRGFKPPQPGVLDPHDVPAAPMLAPGNVRVYPKTKNGKPVDPLIDLKIESELKRTMRENIAHQRMIGSYVGKRHAMGLPVRGQNTQNNSKTAKKLNRVERRQ